MSRITILLGSERNGGNTATLVNKFVEGASQNNEVEVVSVSVYKVNACIGCEFCSGSKDNACFQNDDMTEIYSKLMQTDILVVASPVYFYGISAQLKAIIDRLHTPMRNKFTIRKAALMLVAGADMPIVFDPIILQYKMILDYFKIEDAGMVLVKNVRRLGEIADNPALQQAYEFGKSLN